MGMKLNKCIFKDCAEGRIASQVDPALIYIHVQDIGNYLEMKGSLFLVKKLKWKKKELDFHS